jgi:hypothetical protein
MPRKKSATPRDGYFHMRLTSGELAKLEDLAAAARATKSQVVRTLIAQQAPLKPNPPARSIFDHKALIELSKIGNNINQIAKALNAHDKPGVDPQEFRNIDRGLLQVCALVLLGPERAAELTEEGFKEFMPYIRVKPSHSQTKV